MDYNLNVGDGKVFTSDIVLKEDAPVLRVVVDYVLDQDDNAAYKALISKYAQPVTDGSDGPRFIRSPLRAGNTFAAYMCDEVNYDKPVPMYMRIIDKFNFIARFAIETDKSGKVVLTPHKHNQDAGNTLNIDKLTLNVPEPYAAVLIVTDQFMYSPTLVGMNKETGAIFRIPTPNMHWDNASLCIGNVASDKLHTAMPAGDILAITAAFDVWEQSEWNADLTASLPAAAVEFLKWDVLGNYKGSAAWAKFEKSYTAHLGDGTVPDAMIHAAQFARGMAI